MDTRLYREVFCGQTERVEAHGLEHFKALHALKPRVGIRRTVIVPMPDVELRARGIGEHFQNVQFFVYVFLVENVELGFLPFCLPFAFYGFHIHTTKTSDFRAKKLAEIIPYKYTDNIIDEI